MSLERHTRMEEYARLVKNRYSTLRQASSPGWRPRVQDDKHWRLTGLLCVNHGFDPTEYVEALFIHAKPYPLVARLYSPGMVDCFRISRTGGASTSVEWEKQAACEMEFVNSRINAYGAEMGLRIAMSDNDGRRMSPAARVLVARFTGDRLDWPERRQARYILANELVGPIYVRKFGPVLGRSEVEAVVRELEAGYDIGP